MESVTTCGVCGQEIPKSLQRQVAEFHRAVGQPIADAPAVIPDERVRLRARLIAEEFLETLRAMLGKGRSSGPSSLVWDHWDHVEWRIRAIVDQAPVSVNLTELADGLADLDYVVEGTRLELGIDGPGVAAVVHAANMAKLAPCDACDGSGSRTGRMIDADFKCGACEGTGKRPLKNEHGKIVKPPGWKPPDVADELDRQRAEKSLWLKGFAR